MKSWVKIALGIGVAWTLSMPLVMVWLIMSPHAEHLGPGMDPWVLKLMLLSFGNCLIITPAWIFLLLYAVKRSDWSTRRRILWCVGLIGGPWVLVTWPWFYFRWILTAPADRPLLDPMRVR